MGKEKYIGESSIKGDIGKKIILRLKDNSVTYQKLSKEMQEKIDSIGKGEAPSGQYLTEEAADSKYQTKKEGATKEELARIEEGIETLTGDIENTDGELAGVKQRTGVLEGEIANIKTEAEVVKTKVGNAEEKAGNAEKEVQSIKEGKQDTLTEETLLGKVNGNPMYFGKNVSINIPSAGYVKPEGGIPKEDLTEEVNESLRKADSALQEHQSLEEYAKKGEIETVYQKKEEAFSGRYSDLEGKPEIPERYDDTAVTARIAALESKTDKDTVYDDTAIKERLKNVEDNKAEKSALEGKQDTITDIEEIRKGAELGKTAIQKVATINGQSLIGTENITIEGGNGETDLSGYYTKGEIDNKGYVTAEVLKGYAEKGDIPSLEDYVKGQDLPNFDEFATRAMLDDYVDIGELPDIDDILTGTEAERKYQAKGDYLKEADIAGKADKGESYTKEETDSKYQAKGNYLTSHQDISGKADKSYVDTGLEGKAEKAEVESLKLDVATLKSDMEIITQSFASIIG